MSATYRTVIWKRPLEDAQVFNSDNKRIKWAITNYILHRYCKEQDLWMRSSGDRGNSSNDRDSSHSDRFVKLLINSLMLSFQTVIPSMNSMQSLSVAVKDGYELSSQIC